MRRFGVATGAYVEERESWRRAVERARREGHRELELTAIVDRLLVALPAFLAEDGARLESFERVSLHAPVATADRAATVELVLSLPLDGDVVFHPDRWVDEESLARLGERVVFENMDLRKPFGRGPADVAQVFERWPQAGFCLDVAHVWTNDPTLALGHQLLDAFAPRLRQLHVSGIRPDGTHRPTTPADVELYRPLLERCESVPWLLEAALVP